MNRPQLKRATIVIGACASVGAIAGIAGSAASPSSTSSKSTPAHPSTQGQTLQGLKARRAFRIGAGPLGFAFGPVHAQAVIPKRDGSGFITVTTDAGTLNSVDGTTLHVKEGTDKATYKADVAIDVGSKAKVFRNRKSATLGDLKPGDHVRIITGAPRGNLVIAADDAFLAQQKKSFRQFKQRFRELKKQFRERGLRRGGFGFGPPPGGAPSAPAPPGGAPSAPGAPAPGAYPGGGGAPGGANG